MLVVTTAINGHQTTLKVGDETSATTLHQMSHGIILVQIHFFRNLAMFVCGDDRFKNIGMYSYTDFHFQFWLECYIIWYVQGKNLACVSQR